VLQRLIVWRVINALIIIIYIHLIYLVQSNRIYLSETKCFSALWIFWSWCDNAVIKRDWSCLLTATPVLNVHKLTVKVAGVHPRGTIGGHGPQ